MSTAAYGAEAARTVGVVPRRKPIDPEGIYHVSSRGCYGQTLFGDVGQHELFLFLYGRVAGEHRWDTLSWALMLNHHHFVIRLTEGGLSEGMRELHGIYSRRIHETYGLTRQGHLFRHAFFARRLTSDHDVVATCSYVDLNPSRKRPSSAPAPGDWCSYAATLGLVHPRPFHSPSALLELIDPTPRIARQRYSAIVEARHAAGRQDPSPNHVIESRT